MKKINILIRKKVKEFDEFWKIANDILCDEQAGCYGKYDMVKKQTKGFLTQALNDIYREGKIDGAGGLVESAIKKRDSYITYKEAQQYIKGLNED